MATIPAASPVLAGLYIFLSSFPTPTRTQNIFSSKEHNFSPHHYFLRHCSHNKKHLTAISSLTKTLLRTNQKSELQTCSSTLQAHLPRNEREAAPRGTGLHSVLSDTELRRFQKGY